MKRLANHVNQTRRLERQHRDEAAARAAAKRSQQSAQLNRLDDDLAHARSVIEFGLLAVALALALWLLVLPYVGVRRTTGQTLFFLTVALAGATAVIGGLIWRGRLGRQRDQLEGGLKSYDYLRWFSLAVMAAFGLVALLGGFELSAHRADHSRFSLSGALATIIFGVVMAGVGWIGLDKAAALRDEDAQSAKDQAKVEADHRLQLELIDAQKATRSQRDFEHDRWTLTAQQGHLLEMQRQQQAHDAGQATMQREHQRLLLLIRQPHEAALQFMTIPGTLTVITQQLTKEDKLAQYEAMLSRSQRLIDKVMDDSLRPDANPDDLKTQREAVIKSVLDIIARWTMEK